MARLVARTFLETGAGCDVTVALVPTIEVDKAEERGRCCGWSSSAWSDVSFSRVTISAEAMPVSGTEGDRPLLRGSKGSKVVVAMAVRRTSNGLALFNIDIPILYHQGGRGGAQGFWITDVLGYGRTIRLIGSSRPSSPDELGLEGKFKADIHPSSQGERRSKPELVDRRDGWTVGCKTAWRRIGKLDFHLLGKGRATGLKGVAKERQNVDQ